MEFSESLLKNHIKTLKELSKDSAGDTFMIEDCRKAIDFDAVKGAYVKLCEDCCIPIEKANPKNGDAYEAKAYSVDALFYADNNTIVFVEFKNGKLETSNVHNKVRDSLLIFNDITKKSLAEVRKNSEFILVYNKDLNKNRIKKDIRIFYDEVSPLDFIHKHVAQKANLEFIQFGVERFQGYCFTRVHTFNVTEMNDWLGKHQISI